MNFISGKRAATRYGVVGLLSAIFLFNGCASPEMVSVSDESTQRSPVSAAEATRRAGPHLAAVFQLRCQKRIDKSWCTKPARDHVLIVGDYFHVTRESYPYKTLQAYAEPAVRVHRQTGELILPKELGATSSD
ncbi:MAG: hypothetical protein ACOY5B_09050 [Spirochaetota bacterium]